MTLHPFVEKIRAREPAIGYWIVLDAPAATERLARVGYDYLVIDTQHGLLDYRGMLDALIAVDAATAGSATVRTAGVVRPASSDFTAIGRALDAGAQGLILPLVDTAEQAAAAVRATRYPPHGGRSFGPMRSALRVGPSPEAVLEEIVVLAMIETADGLANVDAIAATPGIDGLYVGPADLALAVGARYPGDPDTADAYEAALSRIVRAAEQAGVSAGMHVTSGHEAANRLDEGFTFATVFGDLPHLEEIAGQHLRAAHD
jgi:2-keto-3-deoxy-L-rhamnonate aldolase RhmA